MISLNCTSCKSNLSIDDAFAGGVCRCQFCGTIQTVPTHLKGNASENGGVVTAQAKALYSSARSIPSGTAGLDGLADAVASSGLSGSGLSSARTGRMGPSSQSQPGGSRKLIFLLSAAGVVILLLLGTVVWMASNAGKSAAPKPSSSGQLVNNPIGVSPTPTPVGPVPNPSLTAHESTPAPPVHVSAPANAQPQFLGTDLAPYASVVYVVDHGNASASRFDDIKIALQQSAESLGSKKKFAVIFWNNDNKKPDLFYPATGMASADKPGLAGLAQFTDTVYASGQSEVVGALKKAVTLHPAAIIIVTAKRVDSGFAAQVKSAAHASARVLLFTLGLDEQLPEMVKAAQLSGGTYRDVSDAELRQLLPAP